MRKYICLGIREIVQIEGGLPLDKKIPLAVEVLRVELRSTGPLGFARGRLAGVPVPTLAGLAALDRTAESAVPTWSFLPSGLYGNSRVTNLAGFVAVLVMVWE